LFVVLTIKELVYMTHYYTRVTSSLNALNLASIALPLLALGLSVVKLWVKPAQFTMYNKSLRIQR